MVPDKFNMVDMGDIDLIESQGQAVDGLYQKLVESIALCRYQCLYNWKFNGILIPPSYVEMELREGEVWINEGVSVDEEDVVHIYSIEPEPPAPVDPIIEPLSVTANGVYTVPSGTDGYNPVDVNVPSIAPVIQSITITQNGTIVAPSGVDGYSPITVNVPSGGGLASEWEGSFTSDTGLVATYNNVNIVDDEFDFTSYINSRFTPTLFFAGCKIDVEVGILNLTSADHRRFITVATRDDFGLIYRNTGKWSLYINGTWTDSSITDPNYFDNSKVTIIVNNGIWSVYKDNVLLFDSGNSVYSFTAPFMLGSTSKSFKGTIKSIKIY